MTRRPRASRALTLTVAGLLLVATGCGGDDGSGDGGGDGASGDFSGAGDIPRLQGEACEAQVELTGAVERSLDGEGVVDVSDSDVAPPATYQIGDGEGDDAVLLTLASAGNGFEDPSVIVLAGTDSYVVPFGEGAVEVADDGSGAEVDAPASNPTGEAPVQVRATFSC
ncbi:hypothetical protein [Nocardioides nanhaiensis]